jgi:Threonine dehydrogenase and related Zn-dependent dehydrogenases
MRDYIPYANDKTGVVIPRGPIDAAVSTIKGYAMIGIGKTGWIEKQRPQCGPLDAIVRPIALSPCTSDVHTVWEGAVGERFDMILGHEGVGEVVEVGSLVKDFAKGDTVIIPAITPDWNSLEAQAGYSMHSHGVLGGWKFSNIKDGLFGELFHVNDADGNMAHLPKGLDIEAAAMLSDMMPTGAHGVELADVQFGDTVAVIGIGPVGLMAVAFSALRGAGRIFAVGSRAICVEVAKKYGATDIINYREGDIAQQILEATGKQGVDRVVIAGGDVDTIIQAVTILKPGGRIGNINYLGEGEYVRIPRAEWGVGMGHKQIFSGLMPGGRLRMMKLAAMITAGRIDPSLMLTHRFAGLGGVEPALQLMKDKPRDLIKPVVRIDA